MTDPAVAPAKSGSLTNLSTLQNEEDATINLRRAKRKTSDDRDLNLETLLGAFTDDLSRKLSDMKVDLENKISKLQEDVKTTIRSELDTFRNDLSSMKDSLTFYGEEQNDLKESVHEMSSNLKTHDADISNLKQQVTILRNDLNFSQQRERSRNLEITAVPEKSNENLTEYILAIAKVAKVDLSIMDIEHVTRVQQWKKVPGKPKTIIAKLRSRLLRDAILSGIRKNRGMTTVDLGLAGESKSIYVNEHLTPTNKLIYKNAREKAKVCKYQYVWVRDGKIFLRKDDKSGSICIKELSDLDVIY